MCIFFPQITFFFLKLHEYENIVKIWHKTSQQNTQAKKKNPSHSKENKLHLGFKTFEGGVYVRSLKASEEQGRPQLQSLHPLTSTPSTSVARMGNVWRTGKLNCPHMEDIIYKIIFKWLNCMTTVRITAAAACRCVLTRLERLVKPFKKKVMTLFLGPG